MPIITIHKDDQYKDIMSDYRLVLSTRYKERYFGFVKKGEIGVIKNVRFVWGGNEKG